MQLGWAGIRCKGGLGIRSFLPHPSTHWVNTLERAHGRSLHATWENQLVGVASSVVAISLSGTSPPSKAYSGWNLTRHTGPGV